MKTRVGVLALQGDFAAHARAFDQLGLEPVLVRKPADLAGIAALAMPGGESTTMSMLLDFSGLRGPLSELVKPVAGGGQGLPVLATCAGVILLARQLEGDTGSTRVQTLGLLDATVARNAYGRQVHSFETELSIDWNVLGQPQDPAPGFHGVFIRAPRILAAGPQVRVAASHAGEPVLLRQDNIIAAAFHPELAGDTRLHAALLDLRC